MEAEASSSKWPFYVTHRLKAPWGATGSTYSHHSDTVSIQSGDSRPLSTSATTENSLLPHDKEPIARPLFHFHVLQKLLERVVSMESRRASMSQADLWPWAVLQE